MQSSIKSCLRRPAFLEMKMLPEAAINKQYTSHVPTAHLACSLAPQSAFMRTQSPIPTSIPLNMLSISSTNSLDFAVKFFIILSFISLSEFLKVFFCVLK